jgi:hypothetical protein
MTPIPWRHMIYFILYCSGLCLQKTLLGDKTKNVTNCISSARKFTVVVHTLQYKFFLEKAQEANCTVII